MKLKLLLSVLFIKASISYGQCDDFERVKDKYEEKITISSPVEKVWVNTYRGAAMGVDKIIYPDRETVYLYLVVTAREIELGEGPVDILLEDSYKIHRTTSVKSKYDGYGQYSYSVYLPLSREEFVQLKISRITDFRIHQFDCSINEKDGRKIQRYLNCIEDLK